MITARPAEASDLNFIYATMLNSLYYGCPFYSAIDKKSFFYHYQQVIKQMLLKRSISLIVACLDDEPDIILGWVAHEPTIVHFVYVKNAWRKQGIATQLLKGCSQLSFVTHITALGDNIRKEKGLKFDPFLI